MNVGRQTEKKRINLNLASKTTNLSLSDKFIKLCYNSYFLPSCCCWIVGAFSFNWQREYCSHPVGLWSSRRRCYYSTMTLSQTYLFQRHQFLCFDSSGILNHSVNEYEVAATPAAAVHEPLTFIKLCLVNLLQFNWPPIGHRPRSHSP